MRLRRSVILFAGLFLFSACENPADKAAKGKVEAAKPEAVAPATGEVVPFSNADSKIAWVGSKVTGKHDGGFNTFTGEIRLDAKTPEKSSLSVTIDTASLFSDNEKLTGHLQSPDFFDVATFPKATFTSTEIAAGGAAGATHTVTGNLELHGVKKSVTFPATITVTAKSVTAKSEFAINRKDFGMVYPGMPDDLIRDEVVIELDIKAARG